MAQGNQHAPPLLMLTSAKTLCLSSRIAPPMTSLSGARSFTQMTPLASSWGDLLRNNLIFFNVERDLYVMNISKEVNKWRSKTSLPLIKE